MDVVRFSSLSGEWFGCRQSVVMGIQPKLGGFVKISFCFDYKIDINKIIA